MGQIGSIVLVLLVLGQSASPAWAKVRGTEVNYDADGVKLKGYLAFDDASQAKRPGVIVVHEWWGHNEYARRRARMLAALGYTALALDMYGDGKTVAHPKDAAKFMNAVMSNIKTAEARFLAALEVLKRQKTTDPSRIAAMGYCFGGGVVLHMARIGTDLRGVASIHGMLGSKFEAKPGTIKARLLVLAGGADPFVPPEQVAAFETEMKRAKAKLKLIVYPGAKHSFSNPAATEVGKRFKLPLAYQAQADKASWAELKRFLKAIF